MESETKSELKEINTRLRDLEKRLIMIESQIKYTKAFATVAFAVGLYVGAKSGDFRLPP